MDRDAQLCRKVFDPNAATVLDIAPRFGHAPQEFGMMLQAIIKPILVALKADQDAGRFTVPRDDDLLGFRQM